MDTTIQMTKIEKIKQSIAEKDKEKTITLFEELQAEMATDEDSVMSITSPRVITELHEMLIGHLGVHPRAMLLKARVPNRSRRANLFVQAMINGIRLSK